MTNQLSSRLDMQGLKGIIVYIKRHNMPKNPNAAPLPVLRSLEDPTNLAVHRRGEGKRPIFDREDIIVNKEDEERVVSAPSKLRRSKSPADKHGTRSRSRSRSHSRSHSAQRRDSYKYRRLRSSSRDKHLSSSGKDSSRDGISHGPDSNKECRSRNEHTRSRSITPRRTDTENYRKYSPSRERTKYSPPLRPGEYRPPKYSKISHQAIQKRQSENTAGPSGLSRSSNKDHFDSRRISISPDRPKGRSPHKSDDSRTKKSSSPLKHEDYRPHSRSPYRHDNSKSRRSRSPYRHKEHRPRSRSPRGSYRERKNSKSPRRYGRSRSPYEEHRRSRRYSRSPHRDDHRRSRRRSPSPSRHSPYRGNDPSFMEPHYKDGGFWIPEAMLASGMIPGFFGPGLRPPFCGPNMKPRPMLPLAMRLPFPPMFRPRPPLVYNQPYRPRIFPNVTVTSNEVTEPSTSDAASSSVNVISTSSDHKEGVDETNVENSTKEEE